MSLPNASIQFEIAPARLENSALEFLRTYWDGRRAGRTMPSRADIKPADLKAYLDGISMVDVLDGGAEFRYRVVGTVLTQYFLTDPTGKTLREAWPNADSPVAARVRANLVSIVETRAPVHAWGTLDWARFPGEVFDMLFVPLSDDGKTVNMILSLFTFDRKRVLTDRQMARERGETSLLQMDETPTGTG